MVGGMPAFLAAQCSRLSTIEMGQPSVGSDDYAIVRSEGPQTLGTLQFVCHRRLSLICEGKDT